MFTLLEAGEELGTFYGLEDVAAFIEDHPDLDGDLLVKARDGKGYEPIEHPTKGIRFCEVAS
jgi:hypothetical protein